MAHSNLQTFSVEIPLNDKEKMQEFQELMNELAEKTNNCIEDLAKELEIPIGLAGDIWYLRTRSRWSENLEKAFIKASLEGHQIIPNGDEVEKLIELGYLK
jgi:hypothetical protein